MPFARLVLLAFCFANPRPPVACLSFVCFSGDVRPGTRCTVRDGRISPGCGKTGRMADTGQGGRFSLSGRYSAIADGTVRARERDVPHL